MRVAGEFSLIFESEVIKSRLVRDANAASISDYVSSPPLQHSSFPVPFFFRRTFLFFLSLYLGSRFTGFLSDADRPEAMIRFVFPRKDARGTIKIGENSLRQSDAAVNRLSLSLRKRSGFFACGIARAISCPNSK